jgi:hypothetical protein
MGSSRAPLGPSRLVDRVGTPSTGPSTRCTGCDHAMWIVWAHDLDRVGTRSTGPSTSCGRLHEAICIV